MSRFSQRRVLLALFIICTSLVSANEMSDESLVREMVSGARPRFVLGQLSAHLLAFVYPGNTSQPLSEDTYVFDVSPSWLQAEHLYLQAAMKVKSRWPRLARYLTVAAVPIRDQAHDYLLLCTQHNQATAFYQLFNLDTDQMNRLTVSLPEERCNQSMIASAAAEDISAFYTVKDNRLHRYQFISAASKLLPEALSLQVTPSRHICRDGPLRLTLEENACTTDIFPPPIVTGFITADEKMYLSDHNGTVHVSSTSFWTGKSIALEPQPASVFFVAGAPPSGSWWIILLVVLALLALLAPVLGFVYLKMIAKKSKRSNLKSSSLAKLNSSDIRRWKMQEQSQLAPSTPSKQGSQGTSTLGDTSKTPKWFFSERTMRSAKSTAQGSTTIDKL